MARLVIVDDDRAIIDLLTVFFGDLGHQITAFENLTDAGKFLTEHGGPVDLIISDLRLPDGTGLSLMSILKSAELQIPVILITAYGSAEIAANALKQGIFDYITKPFNLMELEVICGRAIKIKSLEKSLFDLRTSVNGSRRFQGFIGSSPKMHDVYTMMSKAADADSNVLMTGESGTGKELAALMDGLFSRLLSLKELEKAYIRHVLITTGGKKEEVAAILGIDRKTLYRKEREYNLNE